MLNRLLYQDIKIIRLSSSTAEVQPPYVDRRREQYPYEFDYGRNLGVVTDFAADSAVPRELKMLCTFMVNRMLNHQQLK